MQIAGPYHEGELLVQKSAGEAQMARRNGGIISDSIPKGALRHIERQPMVILASVDPDENLWASLLIGQAGFMKAADDRHVDFDLTQAAVNRTDPFWENIEQDDRVGLLVIDLGSRLRLRINGRIDRTAPDQLRLEVAEAYANCPKYIQRRHLTTERASGSSRAPEPREGRRLKPHQQTLIRSADTFFVASADPSRGADASHRGGNPGFVHVLDESKLRVPDYVGNSMFNTLGNFASNARAGLVFVDFQKGRTLQLTGRPRILWNLEDPKDETGGTKRYWDFEIERWIESDIPRGAHWEFLDYSPYNPQPLE